MPALPEDRRTGPLRRPHAALRTRQGTYATTADGTFLASWNNNNPRFVARKLREALKNWDKLKAEGRKFSGEDPLDIAQLNRADRFFPESGLVLKVNTRDLPRNPPQQGRWANAWNQDFAWFTKEEAGQFLPGEIEPGRTQRSAAAPRRATRPVPFPGQRARTDFTVPGACDRGRDTDQPRHGRQRRRGLPPPGRPDQGRTKGRLVDSRLSRT